jgi:ABC-type branched-subunit amino acid transport system substrate-binding protein/predicted negative regulator of RcsB-dependent stress response
MDQGRYLEAGDAYHAALRRGPMGEQGVQARLGLAKAEAAAGHYAEALAPLKDLLAIRVPPPLELEAGLLTARLERQLGQHNEAVARLRALLTSPPAALTPGQRREVLLGLANSQAALGRRAQATSNLMLLLHEVPQAEVHSLATRAYDEARQAPSREVEPLLSHAVNPAARGALLLALAQAQLKEGRIEQAKRNLELASQVPELPDELHQRLEASAQEAAQTAPLSAKAVGVILPLSGNYAAQSCQVLAAVELGLGVFSAGPGEAPTLYIEDDRGEPATAAEAVTRLAEGRKVVVIIGPLSAGSSAVAARRAQTLGVPLITLTQAEGVTKAGDYIFQNFFSPAEQVAALLDEVMERRGQRRFAMLAPRTTYGQGFMKLFDAGVVARGGQVVHNMSYYPGQTDFAEYLKEMVRLPPGSYRGGIKPQVDFQALFVPDNPERAALIAPQLAYLGINQVTLMGTSLWHSPRMLEMAARSMEGSLFPDAFDPASHNPQTVRFVAEYRQALGREPTAVEAHGYDAALLVRRVLESPEAPCSRQAFRDTLAGLHGIAGVCGELSVDHDHRLSKPLTLFTVQSGVFRTLGAAEAQAGEAELLMQSAPAAKPFPAAR